MAGDEEFNRDKIKEYAASASKVGAALQALKSSDGWQIVLALYHRRKKKILNTRDYPDTLDGLAAFKGDRKALDIVDDLLGEIDAFIVDADEAQKRLVDISGEEGPKERGIMLIESMEDGNRES